MTRLAALALLGSIAFHSAACQTAERLWRISPFEGNVASERVNLWPLAYHNGDETSVLWPLFDVDQRGFALRPLLAKDGTGYSILWPLASFDTDAGTGWAGPFYQFETARGLFPVANFGSLSWVGLVWWSEHASGFFPLAHFGELSYVGPVWWSSADGASAGLFPLAVFGPTSYVGPAWWSGDSYGLFPLFGNDLFGSGIDHIGPVWWRSEAEQGLEFGLAPLLSYGNGGRSLSLLPLYSHELGPDARTRNVLLGLGHASRAGEREESWLLPLYYHRAEPARSDTTLLPFFWKRTRGDDFDVYTLLGNRSVDPASSSFNLYPFWWSNESKRDSSAWRMLLPLFYFGRAGDERTLITPLGGRGWSTSGEEAFVNVFGPLYHKSRSLRRDESRTALLWPLFERHRRGDERTTRIAGLFSRTDSPGQTETSYALGLGHAQRTATGSSHRLWPLYSWSDDEELPGPVYALTLYGWRSGGDTVRQRLFPLFSSESTPSRSEWNALLGLVHHDRAGGETTRSESWWAWPLVSHSSGTRAPGLTYWTALVGSSTSAGGRRFQLGSSLLYSHSAEENEEVRRAHGRALLFFTHEEEEFVGAHVPAAQAGRTQNRIRHESRGFLFDAFLSASSTYHVWRDGVLAADEARVLRAYSVPGAKEGLADRAAVRAVLTAHGVAPADDEPASLRAALDAFAAANTETRERRHVRIPLLYGHERSESERSWYGPLGLVRYDEKPGRERFSLFYYGYRSEKKGAHTSRDIFPFLTWDSGPDETRWSFLWRFLRYERKGERRGGHVLFIPWGDA